MSGKGHGSSSGFVIPNQRVVVVPGSFQIAAPQSSQHQAGSVRLEREGDLVRGIEVTCSCGEVIRLLCDYAPAPPAASGHAADSFQRQLAPDPNSGVVDP